MKSNLSIKNIFLALLAATLSACAALQPVAKPLPPLRVEYTLWWGDYTLLVAKEKGFFDEYGVDVEPVYYPIFSESYADLAAGQIDAALLASGDVMIINRHTPIKIIGVSDDGGYMTVVARPGIRYINDLKGKTVGTLIGTQYELLTLDMLASVRMNAADVIIQNVNPEDAANALANDEIQAAFSWEPFTTQALEKGAHVLYPKNDSARLFPDTLAFRQSVVDQRPQDIRAFMQAWFKAVDYRLNNPEETRQIAAKYIGIPVEQIQPDPNLKIFTYDDNLIIYNPSSIATNSIFNVAQKTAAYLISSGALAIMPDIESIITPKFLPANFRE